MKQKSQIIKEKARKLKKMKQELKSQAQKQQKQRKQWIIWIKKNGLPNKRITKKQKPSSSKFNWKKFCRFFKRCIIKAFYKDYKSFGAIGERNQMYQKMQKMDERDLDFVLRIIKNKKVSGDKQFFQKDLQLREMRDISNIQHIQQIQQVQQVHQIEQEPIREQPKVKERQSKVQSFYVEIQQIEVEKPSIKNPQEPTTIIIQCQKPLQLTFQQKQFKFAKTFPQRGIYKIQFSRLDRLEKSSLKLRSIDQHSIQKMPIDQKHNLKLEEFQEPCL